MGNEVLPLSQKNATLTFFKKNAILTFQEVKFDQIYTK